MGKGYRTAFTQEGTSTLYPPSRTRKEQGSELYPVTISAETTNRKLDFGHYLATMAVFPEICFSSQDSIHAAKLRRPLTCIKTQLLHISLSFLTLYWSRNCRRGTLNVAIMAAFWHLSDPKCSSQVSIDAAILHSIVTYNKMEFSNYLLLSWSLYSSR